MKCSISKKASMAYHSRKTPGATETPLWEGKGSKTQSTFFSVLSFIKTSMYRYTQFTLLCSTKHKRTHKDVKSLVQISVKVKTISLSRYTYYVYSTYVKAYTSEEKKHNPAHPESKRLPTSSTGKMRHWISWAVLASSISSKSQIHTHTQLVQWELKLFAMYKNIQQNRFAGKRSTRFTFSHRLHWDTEGERGSTGIVGLHFCASESTGQRSSGLLRKCKKLC